MLNNHQATKALSIPPVNSFDLAVRRSRHPPAAWIHSAECKPGVIVTVRVGGTFTLVNCSIATSVNFSGRYSKLLMIAGGVGINPLYSMLLGLAELAASNTTSLSRSMIPSIFLAYSCRKSSDFLFLPAIRWLADSYESPLHGKLFLYLTTTREPLMSNERTVEPAAHHSLTSDTIPQWPSNDSGILSGRLNLEALDAVVRTKAGDAADAAASRPASAAVLVCGPLGMSNELTYHYSLLLGASHVHRETWQ